MFQWQVINGRLELIFQTQEDIIQFVDQVLKGPAQQLNLEITVKVVKPQQNQKSNKALDIVRV